MKPGTTDNQAASDLILETERMYLRYQRPGDIDALVRLWTDPETTRYMGGPRNRAHMIQAFTDSAANPRAEMFDLWPAIDKATGDFAGYFGILPKEIEGINEHEIVYMLDAEYRGKGYAFEMATAVARHAFERFGLTRLVALIDPKNAPSEKIAIKLGMRSLGKIKRPDGNPKKLYVIEK